MLLVLSSIYKTQAEIYLNASPSSDISCCWKPRTTRNSKKSKRNVQGRLIRRPLPDVRTGDGRGTRFFGHRLTLQKGHASIDLENLDTFLIPEEFSQADSK